jgi:hypothetical protein
MAAIIPSRLGGGRFYITHRASPDLEEGRVERIRRAYTKKMGKLAAWRQRYGARTILVLEENDIIATRDDLVADAILCMEQEISDKPDEIYLVSTGISSVSWFMLAMRIGERDFYNLRADEYGVKIDPHLLDNVTGC